jgi:type III restriction enzyme
MQFKFDANQDFQLEAIAAVVDLFAGQPRIETELKFSLGASSFAAVPNRLDLVDSALLENLHQVQDRSGITRDPSLEKIEGRIKVPVSEVRPDGEKDVGFDNFSVEMETGTGKTYVYLRTVLELYQRYGYRKFIVVVPSVAIREGVLKTLQVTEKHFAEVYENVPYRYYAYDSANISQVRQFALSDGVEIMVMTLAAFDKATINVLYQTTDRLQGETPVYLVQAARPILILDEPQNMQSENRIAALAALDPLFALRYSATHRKPYNLVYRLTPFDAYLKGLVKRIEVASVVKEGEGNQPYIRLDQIETKKKTVTARITVHQLRKNGTVAERTVTVKPEDKLKEKAARSEYDGYEIEEINPGGQFVRFTNNQELAVGAEIGADKDALFKAQIEYTIEQHLRRQQKLKAQGIKVLSLFFIDRVDNYAGTDGPIKRLFSEAFDDLKGKYPDWQERSAGEVQAAYFASHRTKAGEIVFEDSKPGEAEKDTGAYDLIMKDKERLLSFDEPVSFIFSHSALREGWDNPNVFQICTLNQTVSDMKKRQEVGRGVRLAVDQQGQRVRDEQVNVLTVVANESYERYVASLQSEVATEFQAEIEARYGKPIADLTDEERAKIAEEYGEGILPPKPANARKPAVVHLRKEYTLKPEFQELWEKIKYKTRYAVKIDTEKLIADVVKDLDPSTITPLRIKVTKALVQVSDENAFEALQMAGAKTIVSLAGRYPLPNLVELMSNLLQHTSPPVRLTRKTLLEIVRRMPANVQTVMLDSPNELAMAVVRTIKEKLADQLVAGIQYQKINQWYEMSQFDAEFDDWQDYLVPAQHSIYDQVHYDSDTERQFVTDLEHDDRVKLYVKLPRWFTVATPIGQYNPDWAIVMEERNEFGESTGQSLLYLVAETKSVDSLDKLRPEERRKVQCGEKHFEGALGVRYRRVKTVSQLG